jgi:hypothetical protein
VNYASLQWKLAPPVSRDRANQPDQIFPQLPGIILPVRDLRLSPTSDVSQCGRSLEATVDKVFKSSEVVQTEIPLGYGFRQKVGGVSFRGTSLNAVLRL